MATTNVTPAASIYPVYGMPAISAQRNAARQQQVFFRPGPAYRWDPSFHGSQAVFDGTGDIALADPWTTWADYCMLQVLHIRGTSRFVPPQYGSDLRSSLGMLNTPLRGQIVRDSVTRALKQTARTGQVTGVSLQQIARLFSLRIGRVSPANGQGVQPIQIQLVIPGVS